MSEERKEKVFQPIETVTAELGEIDPPFREFIAPIEDEGEWDFDLTYTPVRIFGPTVEQCKYPIQFQFTSRLSALKLPPFVGFNWEVGRKVKLIPAVAGLPTYEYIVCFIEPVNEDVVRISCTTLEDWDREVING